MNRVILVSLMIFVPSISQAKNTTYQEAIKSVSEIENSMIYCVSSPEESTDCYNEAEKKYSDLVKKIRSENRSKVDGKLWTSISLGLEKRSRMCGSDNLLSSHQFDFYPYHDCLSKINHIHAITAIEMHLK